MIVNLKPDTDNIWTLTVLVSSLFLPHSPVPVPPEAEASPGMSRYSNGPPHPKSGQIITSVQTLTIIFYQRFEILALLCEQVLLLDCTESL